MHYDFILKETFMLTSKQRAYLRSLANPLETILMVGKGGLSSDIVYQAEMLILFYSISCKQWSQSLQLIL